MITNMKKFEQEKTEHNWYSHVLLHATLIVLRTLKLDKQSRPFWSFQKLDNLIRSYGLNLATNYNWTKFIFSRVTPCNFNQLSFLIFWVLGQLEKITWTSTWNPLMACLRNVIKRFLRSMCCFLLCFFYFQIQKWGDMLTRELWKCQ